MAYPAELLAEGESIEFEMRPHWRALFVPAACGIGVVVAAGWLLGLIAASAEGSTARIGTWAVLAVAVLLLVLWTVRPIVAWYATLYVFTDRRIIIRKGLVAREGRDVPLSKVNNVSFSISMAGRLLNYGTLTVDSASDEELVIANISDVELIQREVNHLAEADDARRRRDARKG
jgi:uncharacterized membrane protein YdbT with pleckstrin-like domain